jgi:CheY-like chemotaxis protein
MAEFKDQDLLDEIRFDIQVKDLLKAELVLEALHLVKRETQKKALFEVSRAEAEFSIPLLVGLFVKSPDVANSFPQLRETMYSKILSRPDVLVDLLLKDASPDTKAFLAEVAGLMQLTDMVPALMDVVGSETDTNILRLSVASLGMIGEPKAATVIAQILDHPDKELADTAAKALGKIGTSEAIQLLADRLGNDPDLDHTMIDIFSKVQTPEAIEHLNKTLDSTHAHIRVAGKEKLGAIGVMSVRVLLKNLNRSDPDIVIHSLNVLGDIGDPTAVPAIRNLLHNEPDNANVRFAAYETLGRLPLEKGAFALAIGLQDAEDNVRAAAAKAIDSNYNPMLAGGIRNMTKSGSETDALIMETVINSLCHRIFMDLLEEDHFKTFAVTYLKEKAHPDVRSYYLDILSSNGHSPLVQKMKKGQTEAKMTLRVFTVDDSKMLLNIYRTVLHNLGCEAVPFEFPEEAVTRVKEDRPDVILTDLNMPKLTGVELAVKVREWFTKEDLPIVMVTTQQESEDLQDALAAGINGILHKPFTESHIRTALKEYAGFQV